MQHEKSEALIQSELLLMVTEQLIVVLDDDNINAIEPLMELRGKIIVSLKELDHDQSLIDPLTKVAELEKRLEQIFHEMMEASQSELRRAFKGRQAVHAYQQDPLKCA